MTKPSNPNAANTRKARASNSPRVGRGRAAKPMSLCLCDFDALYASTVASWVRSDDELVWLAPRTLPPLTAAKVMAWGRQRANRYLLWNAASATPVGYTELNEMPGENAHFWIGHFLIAPPARGLGLGRKFVHALLWRAFNDLGAREVSLVVFPDNMPAIKSYEACGMNATGREIKHFKERRRQFELIRMAVKRREFERMAAGGELPPRSILFIEDAALLRQGPIRLPFE